MFERLESINRVILSIGHGGINGEEYDPGAINAKTKEKENIEAKQITIKLSQYLVNAGITVLVVPDFSLKRTIAYINAVGDAHTDWAFEIHKDSTDKYDDAKMKHRVGVYYHPTSSESMPIAEEMVEIMKKNGAHKTAWARVDSASNHGTGLGWIRKPKMLSHLIEAGFIQDNNNDNSDTFYAELIGKAICSLLNINTVI